MPNTTVFKVDIANALVALQMADNECRCSRVAVDAWTPQLARVFKARLMARKEVAQALGVEMDEEELT